MGEAFVHACQHGRIEVVRWFLDRGVHPDVAPCLWRTGLHRAIPPGQLHVIRLLLERGADPSIRDDLVQIDADGWLRMSHAAHPRHPVTQRFRALIQARSR
ncbi:MAG TPA: ankyrin repeat domain-containing protein [Nonomuraea sp.]|nr:ankyrin repeat domain-containing protein [Nonomuraea sp.]